MQALAFRAKALFAVLFDHLGSYAELGRAVATEYRSACMRQLLLGFLAALAGTAGLAIAWLAGLIALWETPWRLTYAVTSAVLLLMIGAVALWVLCKERPQGPMSAVLQTELRKDIELFQQWKRTL